MGGQQGNSCSDACGMGALVCAGAGVWGTEGDGDGARQCHVVGSLRARLGLGPGVGCNGATRGLA